MFINRDWNLTEEEDFKKNIVPKMLDTDGATPQYLEDGTTVGWKIKPMYE